MTSLFCSHCGASLNDSAAPSGCPQCQQPVGLALNPSPPPTPTKTIPKWNQPVTASTWLTLLFVIGGYYFGQQYLSPWLARNANQANFANNDATWQIFNPPELNARLDVPGIMQPVTLSFPEVVKDNLLATKSYQWQHKDLNLFVTYYHYADTIALQPENAMKAAFENMSVFPGVSHFTYTLQPPRTVPGEGAGQGTFEQKGKTFVIEMRILFQAHEVWMVLGSYLQDNAAARAASQRTRYSLTPAPAAARLAPRASESDTQEGKVSAALTDTPKK